MQMIGWAGGHVRGSVRAAFRVAVECSFPRVHSRERVSISVLDECMQHMKPRGLRSPRIAEFGVSRALPEGTAAFSRASGSVLRVDLTKEDAGRGRQL